MVKRSAQTTSFAATLLQLTVERSLFHMYSVPTIAHPAKFLTANGPPFSLATMSTGSRAFGQSEPIRRPTLAPGNCGGNSACINSRCVHL